MEYYYYMRKIQDLLSDGKIPYEWRFGESLKGLIIPSGSLVEHHTNSAQDLLRLHQFGKTVFPGVFLEYVWYAGEGGDLERSPCGSRL